MLEHTEQEIKDYRKLMGLPEDEAKKKAEPKPETKQREPAEDK